MAGSESKSSPEQERLRVATGRLGDWVAPIVVFVDGRSAGCGDLGTARSGAVALCG